MHMKAPSWKTLLQDLRKIFCFDALIGDMAFLLLILASLSDRTGSTVKLFWVWHLWQTSGKDVTHTMYVVTGETCCTK